MNCPEAHNFLFYQQKLKGLPEKASKSKHFGNEASMGHWILGFRARIGPKHVHDLSISFFAAQKKQRRNQKKKCINFGKSGSGLDPIPWGKQVQTKTLETI